VIIGDSSALIALAVVDKLELLEKLYKECYVPQAVYDEVTKLGLGIGELEAITLYKQLDADILLIDDERAKKYAIINDVKVIGSLGILIKAKERGYIDAVKPLLEKILDSEVYISQKLIAKVLRLCNEA